MKSVLERSQRPSGLAEYEECKDHSPREVPILVVHLQVASSSDSSLDDCLIEHIHSRLVPLLCSRLHAVRRRRSSESRDVYTLVKEDSTSRVHLSSCRELVHGDSIHILQVANDVGSALEALVTATDSLSIRKYVRLNHIVVVVAVGVAAATQGVLLLLLVRVTREKRVLALHLSELVLVDPALLTVNLLTQSRQL